MWWACPTRPPAVCMLPDYPTHPGPLLCACCLITQHCCPPGWPPATAWPAPLLHVPLIQPGLTPCYSHCPPGWPPAVCMHGVPSPTWLHGVPSPPGISMHSVHLDGPLLCACMGAPAPPDCMGVPAHLASLCILPDHRPPRPPAPPGRLPAEFIQGILVLPGAHAGLQSRSHPDLKRCACTGHSGTVEPPGLYHPGVGQNLHCQVGRPEMECRVG